MYCGGGQLGFPIGIKNTKFVEDLPMIIPGQFGFAKLYMNVHWMVLYKFYVFCSDMKFKMVATAELSLTLDPTGKMFQNSSSLKLYCGGGQLGFPIGIKNTKFGEDLPMIIPGQFGFNCPSGFREEAL
jgi:hypothetical protein